MERKRPGSFTVFAVLCMVFGGLGLLCDAIGLAGQAATQALTNMQPKGKPGQIDQAQLQKELQEKLPAYQAYQWGNLTLSFVMHVLLLVTGIGLWKMQAWSRFACIAYGLLTILIQLGVLLYTLVFVTPVMDDILNRMFKEQNTPITVPGWALNLGAIAGALLGMTFAVILLIFALRPAMGQQLAMAGQPEGDQGRQDSPDYYDEDYQRQRHEPPPEV
jgi:hypothetical protein